MEGTILEICVDSVESAVNAARGGADRLELCSGLVVGGLTPTAALLEAVRGETGLPVNVLIRPRFGDFCCTPAERALMCREIEDLVGRGAAGVVIGALRPDGTLDRGAMVDMISAAAGANITLHRAMDVCRDPLETLEEALDLGVDTILTSGQAADAWAGRETICRLLDRSAGRGDILIGGGVSPQVIGDFRRLRRDARSFHLSAQETLPSPMVHRNGQVHMGLPGISEFQLWRTSADTVRAAARALRGEG